jgi:hypothetical protein
LIVLAFDGDSTMTRSMEFLNPRATPRRHAFVSAVVSLRGRLTETSGKTSRRLLVAIGLRRREAAEP